MDEDAEVYGKHAEALVRFATVLAGPHEAADLVHSAVCRVLASPAWRKADNKPAYLFTAVLNEARATGRAQGRRRRREASAAAPDLFEPPLPDPEVVAAVAALSMRQRAVTYLTYWEDLDVASVARNLGMSDGSVRRHLARARSRLRRTLDVDDH